MNQERIVAGALLLLALAGCGSGSGDSTSAAAATPRLLAGSLQRQGDAPAFVTFSGNYSQYSITGLSVKDNVYGTVQTVPAGSRLLFGDGSTVALDLDGVAGQTYRLYQTAFNRKPDLSGLGFQMNAMEALGFTLEQVAQNFIDSPEFARTYGSLNDTDFVTLLYANVLHRAPDPDGLAFHVGYLQGTHPDGRKISRAQDLIGFSESPENKAQVLAAIQNGIEYIRYGTTPLSTPVANFAASYNGNIIDGDVGAMSMTVAASGALTATMHSIGYGVDLSGTGTVVDGGKLTFTLSGGGKTVDFNGSIALSSGLATGFWAYRDSTVKGEFNAAKKVEVALAFPQVQQIITQRCVSCHSASLAQAGVRLDSEALIRSQASLIQQVAVLSTVMPYGNATGMTAAERQIVGKWITDGTPP